MNKENFIEFVEHADWCFAKSVPNWPHFYIVEKDLPNQVDFRAAKAFLRESGHVGRFFEMDVIYFEAGGWTYWASPLAKPPESQYMLNRCKTEYAYESLARTGGLPPEGFRESKLSLASILEDVDFKSLARKTRGAEFTVFDVLESSDYEIRHSSVLAWLLDPNGNHGQGHSFLKLFWKCISSEQDLPDLSFQKYSVAREGENENEKLDLFIKAEEWVIVIENKLFSPETGDQLDRYFNYIERGYAKSSRSAFIFTSTPDGIDPVKENDKKNWKPISYSTVAQAVLQFLKMFFADRCEQFSGAVCGAHREKCVEERGFDRESRGVF